MKSLGCKEIWDYLTFRISGNMYHRIGSLVPLPQKTSQFIFLEILMKETETRQENTDP